MSASLSKSTSYWKQEIAKEERLVRIYKAELGRLLSSSVLEVQRSCQGNDEEVSNVLTASSLLDQTNDTTDTDDDDDGWLEQTLEALQSSHTTTTTTRSSTSISTAGGSTSLAATATESHKNDPSIQGDDSSFHVPLDTQWQDDPDLYRLLPHLGGISVMNIQNVTVPITTTTTSSRLQRRSYQMQGRVCAVAATPLVFSVTLTVELPENSNDGDDSHSARVMDLQADFLPHAATTAATRLLQVELSEISKVAAETCSLPLFVRQLQSLAELEYRRSLFLSTLQNEELAHSAWTLERQSAHVVAIVKTRKDDTHNDSAATIEGQSSLVLQWKWHVAWHTPRGHEELSVVDVVVPPSLNLPEQHDEHTRQRRQGIKEILCNPQGLKDLLTCTHGSVEDVIRILVQTLVGAPSRKRFKTTSNTNL